MWSSPQHARDQPRLCLGAAHFHRERPQRELCWRKSQSGLKLHSLRRNPQAEAAPGSGVWTSNPNPQRPDTTATLVQSDKSFTAPGSEVQPGHAEKQGEPHTLWISTCRDVSLGLAARRTSRSSRQGRVLMLSSLRELRELSSSCLSARATSIASALVKVAARRKATKIFFISMRMSVCVFCVVSGS